MLNCGACARQLADTVPAQVTIQFRSNPTGAKVFVDGVEIGKTPMSATFTTDKQRQFMLSKDNYMPASQTFKPVTNGYVWAKLQKLAGFPDVPAPIPPAMFTTSEPNLGGFPLSMVVMGGLGLLAVGYIGYRVIRAR